MKITRRFYCHLGYVALFFITSYFVSLVTLTQSLDVGYVQGVSITWQSEVVRLFIFLFFRSLFLGVSEEKTHQELEALKKVRTT